MGRAHIRQEMPLRLDMFLVSYRVLGVELEIERAEILVRNKEEKKKLKSSTPYLNQRILCCSMQPARENRKQRTSECTARAIFAALPRSG